MPRHQWDAVHISLTVQAEVRGVQAKPLIAKSDTEDEIQGALKVLDDIMVVAKNPAARAAIPELLEKLNFNLWLNFREGKKGTRPIRVLSDGMVTLGDAVPPVRPYGNDFNGSDPLPGRGDANLVLATAGENESPSISPLGQSEDVSFTMVNRGDKI
jgi:hypothetical protein